MVRQLTLLEEIQGRTIKSVRVEDSKKKKKFEDEVQTKLLVLEFTDGTGIRLEASLDSMGVPNSNGGYMKYWPTFGVEKRPS